MVDVKRVGSAGEERDMVDVGFGGAGGDGEEWGWRIGIWRDRMESVLVVMPEVFRCWDVIGWVGLVRVTALTFIRICR